MSICTIKHYRIIFDDGYKAKRFECGFVVSAVNKKNVIEQGKKLKIIKQNRNLLGIKMQECESELKKLLVDREKHKELYINLSKARNETKVVIESQKRLLDKYIFITEQVQSRPSTGKRPVTASGLRLSIAKSQNLGLNF